MSEITRGAIGMPFDMAMSSELSRRQFHQIAQALLVERDALEATVAQQAKMIEHLLGGPTPLDAAADMANAARDGFRGGAASFVVALPKMYPSKEAKVSSVKAAYNDGVRLCRLMIIAAGGSVKDE